VHFQKACMQELTEKTTIPTCCKTSAKFQIDPHRHRELYGLASEPRDQSFSNSMSVLIASASA
jgi:hypothetical protein